MNKSINRTPVRFCCRYYTVIRLLFRPILVTFIAKFRFLTKVMFWGFAKYKQRSLFQEQSISCLVKVSRVFMRSCPCFKAIKLTDLVMWP